MEWTLLWQCREQGGWPISWIFTSRPILDESVLRMSSTEIDLEVLCSGGSWYVWMDVDGFWWMVISYFFSCTSCLGLDTIIRYFLRNLLRPALWRPGPRPLCVPSNSVHELGKRLLGTCGGWYLYTLHVVNYAGERHNIDILFRRFSVGRRGVLASDILQDLRLHPARKGPQYIRRLAGIATPFPRKTW